MEPTEFIEHQFHTLRDEIKAIKTRLFWIVALGLFGVPVLAYFASQAERYAALLVPYFVFVVILMFLAEQNALMRAGRYIREHIEPKGGPFPGWEAWLESRPDLRLMDRHFFACFLIVFFVYYFMTIGMALKGILVEAEHDPVGQYWLYGAAVTYAIGAVWITATLIHHWKSCLGTST